VLYPTSSGAGMQKGFSYTFSKESKRENRVHRGKKVTELIINIKKKKEKTV
jgi:hypothetical protein